MCIFVCLCEFLGGENGASPEVTASATLRSFSNTNANIFFLPSFKVRFNVEERVLMLSKKCKQLVFLGKLFFLAFSYSSNDLFTI